MDYKTSIEDCKMDYKTSTEYNFINESRAAMNTQNLNTRKYIEWRRDWALKSPAEGNNSFRPIKELNCTMQ